MSSDFMPQALDSLLASQRASVYGSSKTGSSDNSCNLFRGLRERKHFPYPAKRGT